MHQPLYKNPLTGQYTLPWALLHGTKDYYDMVSILDQFPAIHQTFNLVPSLIEQLGDYTRDDVKDTYRLISMKPAEDLTGADKVFILENFFQSNWDTMVKPLKRYWHLLNKRGVSGTKAEITAAARYFKDDDFRDLQVLFSLSWIDPSIRAAYPELSRLYEKGSGFSEADKDILFKLQTEIIRTIIPKYKEMEEKGAIELTTSPYFHPIMPLLCDSESAKEAMPEVVLPENRFIHPEDAAKQITMALEKHEEIFGRPARGMWPSEGSVSDEVAGLVSAQGIEWIATDQDILSHTLSVPVRRDRDGNTTDMTLYRPYKLQTQDGELSVVFRDRVLSDLIGFEYTEWDHIEAVEDFMGRLRKIYTHTDDPGSHMVNIILDGENAWEYYKNDGRDFLQLLYKRLSESELFNCVTVSEFLDSKPPRQTLPRIFSGSWINHNFKIWIGHSEDNTAWDHIARTRKALVVYENSLGDAADDENIVAKLKNAWLEIYASEGSDWFWWYGDDHDSMCDEEFDDLFRAHLKKVYELIGEKYPPSLDIPVISKDRGYRPSRLPTAFIEPVFDGEITNYFEWLSAGKLDRTHLSGAMHREETAQRGLISAIAYGFNIDTLFFRLDYRKDINLPYEDEWSFVVNFLHPVPVRVVVHIKGKESEGILLGFATDLVTNDGNDGADKDKRKAIKELDKIKKIASGDVVELGIPFKSLGAKPGDELRLSIDIDGGKELGRERWPSKGFLIVDVPTKDFEQVNWMV